MAGNAGAVGVVGATGTAGRLGVAGCLAAATALLVAGCSSSGGSSSGSASGSGTPSTFAAALAEIPSTGWDGAYFEFGDVADVTQLNNASSGKSALSTYTTVGESQLFASAPAVQGELGFNPLTVTSAVTVGDQLPQTATVLFGSFNASTVGTKLAALGFKQHGSADGGTLWELGTGQSGANNPTETATINVLDVSADRIVLGDSAADVEAVAASGGKSLATDATLAAVASCLGSAKGGLIGSEPVGDAKSPTYVGIGLLADSPGDASEELCVTASSSSQASSIEANWKQQIEHGTSASLKEPWSKLFTDPQATTVGSTPIVVRLTAGRAPGARIGTLVEAYEEPYTDFSDLTDQSAS
jgi:hypothetical protein